MRTKSPAIHQGHSPGSRNDTQPVPAEHEADEVVPQDRAGRDREEHERGDQVARGRAPRCRGSGSSSRRPRRRRAPASAPRADALDDDEHERRPEADVHDDADRDGGHGADDLAEAARRRASGRARRRTPRTPGTIHSSSFSSRHHVEVVARSDQAQRPVGVAGGELVGVAELGQHGALGRARAARRRRRVRRSGRRSMPAARRRGRARCFSGTVRMAAST